MATTSGKSQFYLGTGRRKTAVARVRITAGAGKIIVNSKDAVAYFSHAAAVATVRDPLVAVGCEKTMDVVICANGGGMTSQADAARLGIARALLKVDSDYEERLREKKFLTRDAREKERKKYGRAGARKSFQFSKR